MADPGERAREEFFTEAQEIVEAFSRNLLSLDATLKAGGDDPSLVNEAFRAVHTLKGLAGLFGASKMGMLSHRLEDVLDALRLGRMHLSPQVLDTLFSAVDVYAQILVAEKEGSEAPLAAVDDLCAVLDALGSGGVPAGQLGSSYELDPGLLAVLTEYEEHRLRANIEHGLALYRLRVQFDLATIDRALEEIKERAKRHGEIITYLPTGESASPDTIELDLLMASRDDLATLIGTLGADHVVIEAVPRRRRPSLAAGTLHPPPPGGGTLVSLAPPAPGAEALVEEEPAPAEHAASLKSVTQTVRVDIKKLDHLMNIVGELSIVRGVLSRLSERVRADGQRQLSAEILRVHRNFDRRLGELRDAILEVRMVPLGQVFDRLARVVRQISRDVGKEIRLVITGAETEIDKLIVEELSDPLMHMIRNAIDHGIESAEVRERAGKPPAGTIALNAYQKGNHVMIEIEDDGGGIDEEALLEKAVAFGRIARAEAHDLSRQELLGLIFTPGVSTRDEPGDFSGRGVGMDVVKTNLGKIGGVIDVHSERGIGTKMTITLPITLAIVNALLVRVAGQVFAIAVSSVSEAIVFDPRKLKRIDGREVISLRGKTLPICRLDAVLALASEGPSEGRRYVVVTSLGARRLGLVVDAVLGQEDIVIKALGASFDDIRCLSGATELGDQRVGLVLDPAALLEEVLASAETAALGAALGG
ncbi:MAG: chemotaxis protein CheA [Myxococcales bacterium]|nr:chemotaxis protein CheA [Myxococcales bacterium]